MSASFQRGIARFIDHLFAPGVCLACGSEISDANSLCPDCKARLQWVPNPCQYCGQPNAANGLVCPRCLLCPPRWQKMIAPLQYRGLARRYLLQLKFSESHYLAKTLCHQCLEPFRASTPQPEVLIPVPLHRTRLLERGYNQAREIAGIWSRAFGIPVDQHALTRLRATPGQSGLSATQRANNVRQAFAYAPKRVYRHVALVDDIVTTGSTASEITKTLHRAGVDFVEVWALARVYRR
ncbi:MAG: ComF family protein [Gammaproteobacteria bacterium]|nr:ComF family protein [Gammaproteobacteria bacterium]